MKINGFILGRGVLLGACASLLAVTLPGWSAAGQTANARATTQTARVPARVTQAVDEGKRITLRGNVHPMAKPAFDHGAVPDSEPASRMSLVLGRSVEQEAALEQLLNQQQDKSSPNYHAWLTPSQFGAQFGPADSDIQAVTDWLTSRGFSGIKVSAGHMLIEFSGNVGQVRNAFQTEIHHYLVNGKMHAANVSDPQIPAALAPVVAGVMSLNDFRPRAQNHRLGTFRKTKATGEVKPLFTFAGCGTGGTQPCYGVGPGDLATIYSAPATISGVAPGSGVTIAIVQDSNINIADVTSFRSLFGLPANFSASNIILNGPDPGIQGPDSATEDETEADLDVQVAGGVAPGATIDLVISEDSDSIGVAGTDLSSIYIIDNNVAPIMSESFGACEASLGSSNEQFYNQLWQQASAQGITVIISSGDNGSAGCDPAAPPANQDAATQGLGVSGLASTDYNVAMGGTDFQNGPIPSPFWNTTNAAHTQTSAKSYVPESTWNNSCAATASTGNLGTCTAAIVNADNDPTSNNFGIDLVAGAGGASTLNAKPTWQSGTNGNPADTFRDVPDLSLFSGNGINGSFYIICEMDANTGTGSSTSSCDLNSPFLDFQGVGGTSAAAPAFAGIMAMVNQKTGQRQGNANFVLYQLYKKNTSGSICASNAAAVTATSCVFYDTVTGNNSVACVGGTTNCSNTTAGQFGVVVDPAHTSNPAWLTTTGYDLATGLGSVNVTNLLAAWASATFTADTVSITSTSPATVNITHGQNATFNVKVAPTPTGTASTEVVSLIAKPAGGSQLGIGAFTQDAATTLTGGTAMIVTNLLPGGTSYPVVASYAGDGTFAAGTSAPVLVTVTPEASETAVNVVTFNGNTPVLSTAPSTLAYGSSYILQIAVSDSGGNQCSTTIVACPTGTVTLKDGSSPVNDFSGTNSAKLNSLGFAEDQPIQLAGGSHSLVATYSGDNSYNVSTSPATAVTITPGATTTTVAPSPNTGITTGTAVTLTATVATQSGGAGPTGTVTFSAAGVSLGSAVAVAPTAANNNSGTNAFATATLSHTFTTSGSVTVTAKYATGDGNYSSSTGSGTFTVGTSGTVVTTTVVTSSVTTVASGGSVMLTATVTGTGNNLAGPTGTVQFQNGTVALSTPATCTAKAGTSTSPGTCTATLTATLAQLVPLGQPGKNLQRTPLRLIDSFWLAPAYLLLMALLFSLRWLPVTPLTRRLAYVGASALLCACLAAAIAGCGGGSGSGGTTPPPTSTPHTDSITGVYSGDSTYAGSTSAAVSISVQ
jgi:Pro-kumamolisin, activation domain/Bacterial Ig-like domain (group 3)